MKHDWLDGVSADALDWTHLEQHFPHVAALQACIQDPIHHAEGDVWTHTRMVVEALRRFGEPSYVLNLTGLYHDVEKPSTRVEENGRVSHPKHSRYGAQTAWLELWMAGVSVDVRLAVYALIQFHQKVFHLWDYPDMDRMVHTFACIGSWSDLIMFGRADNAGRICADPQKAEDNLLLLADYVAENLVMLDDASRFAYLRKEDRSKHYVEREPSGSQLTIMSGLPGAGKDTRIRNVHPDVAMVSLDEIRRERKVKPTDDQGQIVQEGFERARGFLRRGEPFIWNGTCVSKLARGKIVALAADYDAHVTIEALDRPLETVLRQNQDRDQAEQVPKAVILGLSAKWEPPTLLEAHRVLWV